MKRKYIFASSSIVLSIILSIYLLIGSINLKLAYPSIIILLSLITLIIIILNIIAYFSRNYKTYNIGIFINFILNIVLIYTIYTFNYNYNFIEESLHQKYQYTTYNIYVQKTNPKYNTIDKLSGKSIGLLNENKINIENHLSSKVTLQYKTYDSFKELTEAIENGEIQSFILKNESNEIKNSNIEKKVRIIYSSKIKEKK